MKTPSPALHLPPRRRRAVENADAARGQAKKTPALKADAPRSQIVHRCRSEESPAYAARILFLAIWLALLLLAGLDRLGYGIDLRHAIQTPAPSGAGNASESRRP